MSSHLGVSQTLELLDRLSGAVRDLTARGDKLNQEFHSRNARERRLREAAAAEQAKQLAAARDEAESAFAAAKAAAEAKYERRKGWIGQAYQNSKEKRLAGIENQTGAQKYELQKTALQAERDRDAGLATAAATLEAFRASLAAEQPALALLEQTARTAFKGRRKLLRLLAAAYQKADAGATQDENQMLAQLRELLGQTRDDLSRFRRFLLLRVFKYWPAWVAGILCEIPLVLQHYGVNPDSRRKAGAAVLASLVALFVLRYLGQRQAGPLAAKIASALGKARRLHDAAAEKGETHSQQEIERIKNEFANTTRLADQELKQVVAQASERRVACRMECDGRTFRILEKNDQLHRRKLDQLERGHASAVQLTKQSAEVRRQTEAAASGNKEAKLNADYQAQWQKLEAEWNSRIRADLRGHRLRDGSAENCFPPGSLRCWRLGPRRRNSPPPPNSPGCKSRSSNSAETAARDKRLTLPGPARFTVPLCLVYPEQGSILFETAAAAPRRRHRRAQQHHPAAARHRAAGPAQLHHH